MSDDYTYHAEEILLHFLKLGDNEIHGDLREEQGKCFHQNLISISDIRVAGINILWQTTAGVFRLVVASSKLYKRKFCEVELD